jgi:4-hydroxybutyryl-CoA dehydratase/vinylacetyl-CoA-Delta-isomerase
MKDPAGSVMPDTVFANIGKLLLATQIYDSAPARPLRSGGSWWRCRDPTRTTIPRRRARSAAVLAGRPTCRPPQRMEVARLIEDLTASHQGGWYSLISLHGGGSPEAMKREIWRNYPVVREG